VKFCTFYFFHSSITEFCLYLWKMFEVEHRTSDLLDPIGLAERVICEETTDAPGTFFECLLFSIAGHGH
jgi:hypothetical protein